MEGRQAILYSRAAQSPVRWINEPHPNPVARATHSNNVTIVQFGQWPVPARVQGIPSKKKNVSRRERGRFERRYLLNGGSKQSWSRNTISVAVLLHRISRNRIHWKRCHSNGVLSCRLLKACPSRQFAHIVSIEKYLIMNNNYLFIYLWKTTGSRILSTNSSTASTLSVMPQGPCRLMAVFGLGLWFDVAANGVTMRRLGSRSIYSVFHFGAVSMSIV